MTLAALGGIPGAIGMCLGGVAICRFQRRQSTGQAKQRRVTATRIPADASSTGGQRITGQTSKPAAGRGARQ